MTPASPLSLPGSPLFLTPAEVRVRHAQAATREARPTVVRRPTPQQGIALEMLGHAIEYLADSNFYHQRASNPAVQEAIAILKQSNREVFAEAPEVVPARERAVRWMRARLQGESPVAQPVGPPRLILVKR